MARPDARLANEVYGRLSDDHIVRGHTIGVRAQDGVVTLSGLPSDAQERARAISIARGTPGVREVTNPILP
jgi:osmotically-inducible protein OsmY